MYPTFNFFFHTQQTNKKRKKIELYEKIEVSRIDVGGEGTIL